MSNRYKFGAFFFVIVLFLNLWTSVGMVSFLFPWQLKEYQQRVMIRISLRKNICFHTLERDREAGVMPQTRGVAFESEGAALTVFISPP